VPSPVERELEAFVGGEVLREVRPQLVAEMVHALRVRPTRAVDFDLTDPATFREGIPHELFARLRREDPVAWHPTGSGGGFWSLTRHADVVVANRDTDALSSARGGNMIFDRAELKDPTSPRMMIEMDPPRHTRYRLLVNRGFTPRMIGRLEDFMRAVTTRTLDRLEGRREADFVEDVAAELPIQVIAELLGVPEDERAHLFELSNRIIGFDEPEYGNDGQTRATLPMAEIYAVANRLGAEKRAALEAGHAAGDIVTTLLTAEPGGEKLTEFEFDLFFMLLAVAGNETTRTAIAQGMRAFIADPGEWERLRADRSLLPSAVEEILRYSTPILHFRRTATRDAEIAGCAVREGDRVVFWYGSANFDEDVFSDPLRFDIARAPNEHVTFGGGGPHYCLGANLARLEVKVMFEQLLDRMPLPELAGPVELLTSNFANGIKRMPVRWN
jgi:cholest-4-en-3-one 26-monooxygenase